MPAGKQLVEKIHGGAGKHDPQKAIKLIFAGVPKEHADPTHYKTPTPDAVLHKIKAFAEKNGVK